MKVRQRRRPDPSRDRPTQLAGIWLSWWAGLFLIWLLLVDTVETQELLVGAIAASVAASVAIAVHRQGYIRFSPRAAWLREIPSLLWDVIVDCGLLGEALWNKLVTLLHQTHQHRHVGVLAHVVAEVRHLPVDVIFLENGVAHRHGER